MTPDQIQRLRELAARATPGPWETDDDAEGIVYADNENYATVTHARRPRDAEYLAALSPEVLVGLLDELERLRERDRVERIHQARLAELQREVDDYRAAERPSDWERGL